jgi:tRNA pseudouridine55 synthase
MIDGILLIDKEVGITSYDVIRKLKKILEKGQKIGHAGTLDPFATGLLVILLGKGTKLMDTFHTLDKGYVVEGKLGISTDTQDITGKIVNTNNEIQPTIEEIENSIKQNLTGNILQIPPIYSAKKIKGRKAYDIAREGGDIELTGKRVTVKKFEVIKYEYPTIVCEILCSSGTYIRTLINDLGVDLGCFATAVNLRRTSIGEFFVKESIESTLISEENSEKIHKRVIDISKVINILDGER